MKRFLSSDLYKESDVIGFDLDGTLYDEFEFIYQVYMTICELLCKSESAVFKFMINKWLSQGSSYPFIFKETMDFFGFKPSFESESLDIFRKFSPDLKLSMRNKFLLETIREDGKQLFLLSDGRELLQSKKITSLGCEAYFDLIIIAETYQKPDTHHARSIVEFFDITQMERVLYIGDRTRDQEFAINSGFRYLNINGL